MGRIFSWEEIEHGKIPELKSFREVVEKVRKELAFNEKVETAILCGSALRDDLSITSDIDCVVIYNDETVFLALKGLIAYAKALYVPLEIIPIDIRMIKMGIHSLNGSFLQHLKRVAKEGGIIKGDPILIFRPTEDNRTNSYTKLRDTFEEISSKLNRALCELSRFEGEKRIFNLGKILEAPMDIVRQIIWAQEIPIINESKEEVLKAFWTIADKTSKKLLVKVLEVDEEYSELLEKILKQSAPGPYKDEYIGILKKIEEIGQNEALEFIVYNAQLLTQEI